jgi:hypothetical protein
LSEWRVTTGDPDIAERIAELLGGTPEESGTDRSDNIQVMTSASRVPVHIQSANDLRTRMILHRHRAPAHGCERMYFLADQERGQPCGCRDLHPERKEHTKCGGPKPDISLRFRLSADPKLGTFLFASGSWSLVADLPEVERRLSEADGPVAADLGIIRVQYTTKDGKGVAYHRPEITVTGRA